MLPARPRPSAPIPPHAALERYFELALYLLVLTGFGTLASTGGLDSPTVMLVGAALLCRGFLLARQRTLLIPERWTTLLTLGYVAFYLADYFLISGVFLKATVHLVLFVMLVRLFSAQRDRDHYFLAVIAFLMVLSAAVLTVDSIFLLAFVGFMLMAVVTFILMEMRQSAAKATIHSQQTSDPRVCRHMAFWLTGASPALVLFISLGAAAIFFVLPRVSAGYLSAYAPGSELSTGFSDRVELGRIGEIQQSSSVVMHIQIDGDQKGVFDLKWRGVALNLFDGTTWSNPPEQRNVPRTADGRFDLRLAARGPASKTVRPIHYRVLMEPVGSHVFFLAGTPQSLQGNYRLVVADGGGAVFDLDPEHPVSRYEAISDLAQPAAGELRAAGGPYPLDVVLQSLKLPPLDPRIRQLAEQITLSADSNYDKAVAIETYLRTHFAYTLELPRAVAPDPLANFLFERQQGHCEYFASSMAVMLRALRIPARVVNGFSGGEFNDLTSQYLVRASNAHSWVEAYFPGYGWVSFDPTPAGSAAAHTGWSRAALYVDALASFWREWVINYDLNHQQILAVGASSSSREGWQAVRSWAERHYQALLTAIRRAQHTMARAPAQWGIAGLLITALLLLGGNAQRLWQAVCRLRVAARPERSPRLAATIWYERMTRTTGRRGWRKLPVQTPEEFVASIPDATVREVAARFTWHYEHARFGGSAESAQHLPGLYEEIASGTKR
jgi:protein-glutamine gamma-glutamyltransferase